MSARLDGFEILRELSAEDLTQLDEFLEKRSLDAGAELFWHGEESAELLLMLGGRLRLERDGELLGVLDHGAALGGASLVRIGQRECSARAESPLTLLSLSRESYLRLRAEHPQIALALQEGILSSFAATVHEALV